MKKNISIILLSFGFLMIIGCGSSTDHQKTSPDALNTSKQPVTSHVDDNSSSNGINNTQTNNQTRTPYQCTATQESESKFIDTFISKNHEDIDYPDKDKFNYNELNVNDIETLFNNARANDPTVLETLKLPNQDTWNHMTADKKMLYLVNSERCARGLRIFEGIDPTLENSVTKVYAEYIADHEDNYLKDPHGADGRTLEERMDLFAGIKINDNADYLAQNIASISLATTDGSAPLTIYEPEAKSVYAWMYMDKAEGYGHREFILKTQLKDDTGMTNEEGLIAAYTAHRSFQDDQGLFWTKTFTVMDGFDPRANWDNNLANVQKVTLYQ